jgi:hypothetical protein
MEELDDCFHDPDFEDEKTDRATAGYFYDTFAYEICFYGIYFYRISFYGTYFYKAFKFFSIDCTFVRNT